MHYLVMANVAKIGRFSLKVHNSLVHGGPYLAVQVGKKRVAWISFKTCLHTTYAGVTARDLEGIEEVERWLADDSNFNRAAAVWNGLGNGVTVVFKKKEKPK